MDHSENSNHSKTQNPLRLPPEGLGVAPVRLLAAGEGKIPGTTPSQRLLILRLLARRAQTGNPVRLDLALTPADAILLARAAIRFLRQGPSSASPRTISGQTEALPSNGAAETNIRHPQNP